MGAEPVTDARLLVASRKCSECLTTRNRIVPGARAAEIVRGCRRTGNHFVCHKGSIVGLVVHCRGVHDMLGGGVAYRFGVAIGLEPEFVDPDTLEDDK